MRTAKGMSGSLRTVVLVTDKAGDFVGVGMNTRLDDAMEMMKSVIRGRDVQFDLNEDGTGYISARHDKPKTSAKAARP